MLSESDANKVVGRSAAASSAGPAEAVDVSDHAAIIAGAPPAVEPPPPSARGRGAMGVRFRG